MDRDSKGRHCTKDFRIAEEKFIGLLAVAEVFNFMLNTGFSDIISPHDSVLDHDHLSMRFCIICEIVQVNVTKKRPELTLEYKKDDRVDNLVHLVVGSYFRARFGRDLCARALIPGGIVK